MGAEAIIISRQRAFGQRDIVLGNDDVAHAHCMRARESLSVDSLAGPRGRVPASGAGARGGQGCRFFLKKIIRLPLPGFPFVAYEYVSRSRVRRVRLPGLGTGHALGA